MFAIILLLIFFSIAAAYYFNEKRKIKEVLRHEKMQAKQQEVIDRLRERKDRKNDDGQPTQPDENSSI